MASSPFSPLLLLPLVILATVAIGSSSDEPKEKMTHLHFYFYDYYGGPNATTITVVSPPGNSSFGSIGVGDNILREGPESSSKLIGRAQELAVQAGQESTAYLSALNFVFTAGEYNGSGFSILGRAVLTETMERASSGHRHVPNGAGLHPQQAHQVNWNYRTRACDGVRCLHLSLLMSCLGGPFLCDLVLLCVVIRHSCRLCQDILVVVPRLISSRFVSM
ncbi:unnamed protein product [Musa acuminata subsp. burmannicoides]